MMHKKESSELTEDDLLVYGRYAKVIYNLQSSNQTQMTYKGATLTWILATYVGIGYSPSSFEVNLPFNSLLVVTSICLASLLILCGIWYLDLIVEEKKIAKAVHNGLALEERYSFLPRAFHNIIQMNILLGYVSKKSRFYISWVCILTLTICGSATIYFYQEKRSFWFLIPIITVLVLPLLFFISNWIMKVKDPYPVLDKIHREKNKNGN